MYETHVGIDWASAEHEVCVLDSDGHRLARFAVTHSEEGLDDLVGRLGGFADRARVGVAIERPDGLVVDRLLEAGHPVVAVKPAAIRAYRSGETPSGAKSDRADAENYCRVSASKGGPTGSSAALLGGDKSSPGNQQDPCPAGASSSASN